MDITRASHDGDLLRLAFDLAPAGMLAIDAGGSILLANREAERMFGFGPGELGGTAIDLLVPAANRAGHAGQRAAFFESHTTRSMGAGRELVGVRRDGGTFPVEVGLSPAQLSSGLVVVTSVIDITARREAERRQGEVDERARSNQKLEALGTLAGGIAHDFNNILLGIVGYTELAQRSLAAQPGVAADLDQVLRAAERGRQLVRRILMFTRHSDVPRVPLSLDRVVREAAELLRASLPASIRMDLAMEPGLPLVMADETLVHQVVLNLGSNSAHAMERGGVLYIGLSAMSVDREFADAHPGLAPGHYVQLSVADTGAGMQPEVRARMFEPFFTTKSPDKGTGLGLSVILGIVQSLSGAIEVSTEAGRGTRVDVWLPASDTGQRTDESTARRSPEGPGLRVLFVEDEPGLAAMETRQLESLGYRVTVHTSSVSALEDFRAHPGDFDLMLTDNSMPQLTGLALAKQVTSLRPDFPVLMVSGYADNAEIEILREHGVRAVLGKPHTAAELGEALRRLSAAS